MNSTGECGAVFDSGVYDHWVISHTLLPFFIFWTGIVRPLNILLLVYMWETVELGFRHCSVGPSNWADEESLTHVLVVDPVVAILALLVQILLRYRFDKQIIPTSGKLLLNIFFFVLACSPTFFFFDVFYEKDLHYMFIPSSIGLMLMTKPDEKFGMYDIVSILFVLVIFFTIDFATNENSFIMTILVCSIFVMLTVISIALKKRSFEGIGNFL